MKTMTRRLGLQIIAGAAAAPAAAMTDPPDPIHGFIEAHRRASAAHGAALEAGLDAEEECHAEWDTFERLIRKAPATLAGLVSWTSYLDSIRRHDGWMLNDHEAATPLVAAFSEAVARMSR